MIYSSNNALITKRFIKMTIALYFWLKGFDDFWMISFDLMEMFDDEFDRLLKLWFDEL